MLKNSNTTSFLSTSDMVKEVPDLLWNSCTRSLTMILCHSGLRSKRFCIAAEIEATKNDDILDVCIGRRSLKESLHKKSDYSKNWSDFFFSNMWSSLSVSGRETKSQVCSVSDHGENFITNSVGDPLRNPFIKNPTTRKTGPIFFSRTCEVVSQFPVGKPNLKSVASQTTEKILSQILWAIP